MANAESRRLQQHVHQQPQQLIRRRHLVPFHEPYGVAGVESFCFLFTTAGVLGEYCTAFLWQGIAPLVLWRGITPLMYAPHVSRSMRRRRR